MIRKLLIHMTTLSDNKSFDIVRIMGLFMGLQFLGNALFAVVVKGHDFDPNAYGLGAAALLAALGAAMRLRPGVPDETA